MGSANPGQDRKVHGLPILQGLIGLHEYTLALEVGDGVSPVEEGVDFDLIHSRLEHDPTIDELLVVLHGVVQCTDIIDLPLPLQFSSEFCTPQRACPARVSVLGRDQGSPCQYWQALSIRTLHRGEHVFLHHNGTAPT